MDRSPTHSGDGTTRLYDSFGRRNEWGTRAINPRRRDLLEAVKGSGLPVRPIQEIKTEVEALSGGPPAPPRLGDKVVAAIKWVDGTVIDCVKAVAP